MIFLEELYLFETVTNSPFIFDPIDGLDIKMGKSSKRVIDTLNLERANFFFDIGARAKIEFELERGIDDFYIEGGADITSKESGYISSFELFFNRTNPVIGQIEYNLIAFEQLISKRYSIIGKVNGRFKAVFQEFSALPATAGNFNQNLIKFKSTKGYGYPYLVENLTVNVVEHSIVSQC